MKNIKIVLFVSSLALLAIGILENRSSHFEKNVGLTLIPDCQAQSGFGVTRDPCVYYLAARNDVTCVIVNPNHNVKCWGRNNFGQLGNGTTVDSNFPVDVTGVTNARALVIGTNHVCAAIASPTNHTQPGPVKCWGRNSNGQLGAGFISPSESTPVDVLNVPLARELAADGNSTCASMMDGSKPKCWGANESGKFGLGSLLTNISTPIDSGFNQVSSITMGLMHMCVSGNSNGTAQCAGVGNMLGYGSTNNSLIPVNVSNLVKVEAVAAGERHTCALSLGRVRCWGMNDSGQRGDGTPVSPNPFLTPGGNVVGVTAAKKISAGDKHSCAIDGQAIGVGRCWGDSAYGKLGNNSTIGSSVPVPLSVLPPNTLVSEIRGGNDHTCVVTQSSLRCFGRNNYGQLGNATNTNSMIPVIPSLTGVRSLVSAGGHVCVIINGTVKCWGENDNGQLGKGYVGGNNNLSPNDPVLGINNAVMLAGAGEHQCALLSTSQVKCWGKNQFGQIGIGTSGTASTSTPPILNPTLVPGISNATKIFASRTGTCAILGNGANSQARCWGNNQFGQIGNGNTLQYSVPTPSLVAGISNVSDISMGEVATCFLIAGSIKCVGQDYFGSLGNGPSNGNQSGSTVVPVDVVGISNAIKISARNSFHCALLSTGGVNCWGLNGLNGYLGNGNSNSESDTPTPVVGITNAIDISVGYNTSCATLANGQVQCWGMNPYGELGTGTTAPSSITPILLNGISAPINLSMGDYNFGCALQGCSIKCWGLNVNGQLGLGTNMVFSATPLPVVGL